MKDKIYAILLSVSMVLIAVLLVISFFIYIFTNYTSIGICIIIILIAYLAIKRYEMYIHRECGNRWNKP